MCCIAKATATCHICSNKKKTGAKKTALKFEYAGQDLTCLEQRLTQGEIDRVLGSDLLVRAVFHGQSDITALLEVHFIQLMFVVQAVFHSQTLMLLPCSRYFPYS